MATAQPGDPDQPDEHAEGLDTDSAFESRDRSRLQEQGHARTGDHDDTGTMTPEDHPQGESEDDEQKNSEAPELNRPVPAYSGPFRISPTMVKIAADAERMAEMTRPLRETIEGMQPLLNSLEKMRVAREVTENLRPIIKLVDFPKIQVVAEASRQIQLFPGLSKNINVISGWLQTAPPIQLNLVPAEATRAATDLLAELAPQSPEEEEQVRLAAAQIEADPESSSKIRELISGIRKADLKKITPWVALSVAAVWLLYEAGLERTLQQEAAFQNRILVLTLIVAVAAFIMNS
jgi:hypothetical protein